MGEEGDGGEHREDETPMVAQAIPLTPQMYVQGVAEAPDITKWFPPAVPAVCSPVIERGGQIIFTEDWITSQANSPVAHFISSSFTTTPVTPAPGSTTHGGHVFPTSASAAALGSGSHRGGTPAHGTHGPILLPHPHILSHTSGSPVTPPSSTEMNSNATHWTHTTSHPALEESSDVAGVGVSPAVRHALGGAAPSFKIRDPSKIYGSAEYIRSSSTSPAPAPPAASSASSSASPPAIPSEATSTTKHIVPQSDAPTRGGSAKTPKHQPQPSSLTVEKTKKINTATSAAKSEGEKKETRKGTIAGTRAESIATAAAKAAESPLPDHSKSGITTNAMTSEPTSPAGSVASSASGAKTYNKSPSGKTASFTIATIATHKQGATQTSKKSHLKEKR